MPSLSLDHALNSQEPSSLALTSLRQKQNQRLHQGRGNSSIGNQYSYRSDLQKQYALSFPSDNVPSPSNKKIPPLNPSVQSVPGAEDPGTPEFLKQPSDSDNTMAGQSSLRNIASQYTHKYSESGNAVQLKLPVWEQILQDIKDLQKEVNDSHVEYKKLEKDAKKLSAENRKLTESAEDVALLEQRIEKLQAKKRKGTRIDRKDEINEDVKAGIDAYVKDVLFRTHKFAFPGRSLDQTTKLVWNGIKGRMLLDQGHNAIKEEDFVEIYGGVVLAALSTRRQYAQSRCKNSAIKDWLQDSHTEEEDGNPELPTIEEIENVWNIPIPPKTPVGETEQAKEIRMKSPQMLKYKRAVKVLAWWIDSFMPAAVGLEFWGPDIRPFRFMTDKARVAGDNSGKDKVLVTITSEAFAHLLYANCRDNWQNGHDYVQKKLEERKANGSKSKKKIEVPKYSKKDETTWPFRNKWTNGNSGQVAGGGWSKEAIDYMEERKKIILEFRKMDAANGNKAYILAKKLICAHNDIKLDEVGNDNKATKRKGEPKNSAEEPANKKQKIDIVYIDE